MSLSAADSRPVTPHWHWLPWQRGTSGEAVARVWLAPQLGCTPASIPLTRDRYGRPRLGAPFATGDIGWSHSGDGLLLAFGCDIAVGIDLEQLRPRPRALDIAARFFRADEAHWLAAHADGDARAAAFARLWCAKEAVLKAHGRGLAFGLDRIAFAERDGALQLVDCDPALGAATHWQLHEFVPQPGYRAALAWRTNPRDVD